MEVTLEIQLPEFYFSLIHSDTLKDCLRDDVNTSQIDIAFLLLHETDCYHQVIFLECYIHLGEILI